MLLDLCTGHTQCTLICNICMKTTQHKCNTQNILAHNSGRAENPQHELCFLFTLVSGGYDNVATRREGELAKHTSVVAVAHTRSSFMHCMHAVLAIRLRLKGNGV